MVGFGYLFIKLNILLAPRKYECHNKIVSKTIKGVLLPCIVAPPTVYSASYSQLCSSYGLLRLLQSTLLLLQSPLPLLQSTLLLIQSPLPLLQSTLLLLQSTLLLLQSTLLLLQSTLLLLQSPLLLLQSTLLLLQSSLPLLCSRCCFSLCFSLKKGIFL